MEWSMNISMKLSEKKDSINFTLGDSEEERNNLVIEGHTAQPTLFFLTLC